MIAAAALLCDHPSDLHRRSHGHELPLPYLEPEMPSRRVARSRGILAAGSVVLGAAAGLLINVVSGRPSWSAAAGMVVLVAAWAGLEWWRAKRTAGEAGPGVDVRQRVRLLGRGVNLVGVRQPPRGAAINVDQRVGKVETDSSIVGYEGDARA